MCRYSVQRFFCLGANILFGPIVSQKKVRFKRRNEQINGLKTVHNISLKTHAKRFRITNRSNTYREDKLAIETQLAALTRELAERRNRMRELRELEVGIAELESEILELRKLLQIEPRKQNLGRFDGLQVANPCSEDWYSMEGDDHKRFCNKCQRHVYDLSALSEQAAEQFLKQNQSARVRLYRRADGSVLNGDCPVGESRTKCKILAIAALGAGLGTRPSTKN